MILFRQDQRIILCLTAWPHLAGKAALRLQPVDDAEICGNWATGRTSGEAAKSRSPRIGFRHQASGVEVGQRTRTDAGVGWGAVAVKIATTPPSQNLTSGNYTVIV